MGIHRRSKLAALGAALALVVASFSASPDDIDLFVVDEGNNVNKPNVLFVLDNSANWARQSQQWPSDDTQGQSEVEAIRDVISTLDANINVGMLEYVTGGSSADTDSGYVRYHIRPMTNTNKTNFSLILKGVGTTTEPTSIYANINAPIEKRSSGNPFGTLFWDVYNYLAGDAHSNSGTGTPASKADASAYTTNFSQFRSPLTAANTCGRTIIIFIGNNVSSGPTGDGTNVVTALSDRGGNTTQIPFADFNETRTAAQTPLGFSQACHSTAGDCTTAENNAACEAAGFTPTTEPNGVNHPSACECSTAGAVDCLNSHFSKVGTQQQSTTSTVSGPTTTVSPNTYTGEATSCRNNSPPQAPGCPGPSSTFQTVGNQTTQTDTSWASCVWHDTGTSCGSGGKTTWEPRGTRTRTVTVTETTTTTTTVDLGETTACYGSNTGCTNADFPAGCPQNNGNTYTSCSCTTVGPSGTSGCPAGGGKKFPVLGNFYRITATQTGTFTAPPTQGGTNFMADEWTRFLRQTGVTIPGTDIKQQVTTYTVDVFNAQRNATFSSLLFNMARVGGGKYFRATNATELRDALTQIFSEIQAVNSAFASASLPVNATNRAQNENQVFIGLFKPDRTKDPRWFGNLKQYKLIQSGSQIELGDKNSNSAVDNSTGFLAACAASFWTTDSQQYWFHATTDDPDALGTCQSATTDPHSDLPDGPFAEKGGVAQVLRKGNNRTAGAADAEGNFAVARTMLTLNASNQLVDFDNTVFTDDEIVATTNPTRTKDQNEQTVVDFIRGHDTENDDLDTGARSLTEPRSTIHGDVIHSRPLPVNYGGSTGVVVYYGSNDGTFRAVRAPGPGATESAEELWSFVAPEHFGKLKRLRHNLPLVQFFDPDGPTPGLEPRDYFFDGSVGLLQNLDNTDVRVFPTMRRGGRKIYAFDVSASKVTDPDFLWSRGCPNPEPDTTDCDTGFEGIGQTWGTPNVAFVKGYDNGASPVIFLGGGYDSCEDDNSATPPCASAKGRVIYVLDAGTGDIVQSFDLSGVAGTRSVAADVVLMDVDFDHFVDYAYAVDTGGNVYRIDLIDGPATRQPLPPDDWKVQRVAYTNGDGRKFLFPPALLQAGQSTVYLAIGSGDREHPLAGQYPYQDPVTNRFYVFKDDLDNLPSSSLATALANGIDLDDDSEGGPMIDHTDSDNDCEDEKVRPDSEKDGWFIDLTANGVGEQTVTSALIATGLVFFSTNRPTPEASAEVCSASLGEARGYILNLLNGAGAIGVDGACAAPGENASRSAEFVGGGLPPSPVLATVVIGGQQKTVAIGVVGKDPPGGGCEGDTPFSPCELKPSVNPVRTPVYWYKSSGED